MNILHYHCQIFFRCAIFRVNAVSPDDGTSSTTHTHTHTRTHAYLHDICICIYIAARDFIQYKYLLDRETHNIVMFIRRCMG